MTQSILKVQTERVLDETVGAYADVIVCVDVDASRMRSLMRASRAATELRRVSTHAQESLPPEFDRLPRSKRKKFAAKAGSPDVAPVSMAAQAAEWVPTPVSRGVMRKLATQAMKPVLGADAVKQIMGRSLDDDPKSAAKVTTLWSSGAIAVRATKDEVRDVVDLPGVLSVAPNRELRLPPVYEVSRSATAVTPHDNGSSTWGLERANVLAAWGGYSKYGSGVRVAVLDTGVDASHPDLEGKVVDWGEWDKFGLRLPKASKSIDTREHGTHVAATIAGGDASGRWIGVAPNAEIIAGTVLPGGTGTDAQILAGIDWALEEGADVINLSLGGLSFAPDVNDVYTSTIVTANLLGVPVVVAMGNDGLGTTGSPGDNYFAFTVGATDVDDRAAGFSAGRSQVIWLSDSLDPSDLPLVYQKPDIAAPGVAVMSAVPGGEYAAWNGTSMATPHVAGAIALLLSNTGIAKEVAANTRAFVLQDLIRGSVRELGESGQDQRFGHGRIDVLRAIGEAWRLGYA